MNKIKIGISVGDINGIGLEVILKTLTNKKICDFCTPVVYGSSKVVSYHKNIVDVDFQFQILKDKNKLNLNKINIVNCWQENINISLGKATEQSGRCAFVALSAAVKDLREGYLDALVTAPINKEAMKMAGFPYPGHTEFLTHELGAKESLMFMVHEDLRIGLVTNHLPLEDVTRSITKERVSEKIEIMNQTLKMDFGFDRPTIAVLGLNPHASDNGVIGDQEEEIIRPAIIEAKKKGLMVVGPFSADGFFGSGEYKKYDGILAMFHDQGLIPFKLLSFGNGVNYTAGLSAVRTSPDHGTAYDIAGKNIADHSSFQRALFAALDIARNRKDYFEMRENALVKKSDKIEVDYDDDEGEDKLVEEDDNRNEEQLISE